MGEGGDSRPSNERWQCGVEPGRSDGRSGAMPGSDLRRLVLLPALEPNGGLESPTAHAHRLTPRSSNSPKPSFKQTGKGSPRETVRASTRDSIRIGMPPSPKSGSMKDNGHYSELGLEVDSETEEEVSSRRMLRIQFSRKGREPLKYRFASCFRWMGGLIPPNKYEMCQRKLQSEDVRKLDVFLRLRAVYKVPPPIKLYDATTPYQQLLRTEGSVLKLVVCRIDFWFLLLFHVFLSVYYYRVKGYDTSKTGADGTPLASRWPEASTSLVAIPGVLIAFLLVFYNNQCYSRFAQQYLYCQFQTGIMSELVLLLRAHVTDNCFPEANEQREELWRLLHAMHLLGFAGLPQQRAGNVDLWAWYYAFERNLLSKEQIDRLKPLMVIGTGSLAYKEVMTWLQRRFWNLCKSGRIHPKVGMLFSEALWRLRSNIDVLYVMTNGPIPFAYYHLANTVLIVYLVILAYTFVFVSPYYSVLGYTLILLALLGMSELSNVLADPFGTDETDIPIFDFVNSTYLSMKELIHIPPWDVEEEVEFAPFMSVSDKSIGNTKDKSI